jgi:hypothetical protein
MHVLSKSGSKEGYFNLEVETAFPPPLSSHCSGVTETSHVPLPHHALQPVDVWSKSVSKEGHFTLYAETVFRPVSPYLAPG